VIQERRHPRHLLPGGFTALIRELLRSTMSSMTSYPWSD
jgi:hypothetical protein